MRDQDSPQKTILVIEDEVLLRDAAKIKLEKEGYRCLSALTAEEGLAVLEKETPDLVWLDLLLPGIGGFQFLETLRRSPQWENLPVMVVSVSCGQEKIKRAFELKASDYVIKTQYRLEEIIKKVDFIVKGGN